MSDIDNRMKKGVVRPDVTWGELPLYRRALRLTSQGGAVFGVILGMLFVAPLGSRVPDAIHTHIYHFKKAILFQTDMQATLYWWAFYGIFALFGLSLICGVIERGFKDASFKEREAAFWQRLSDEQK
jgi:hypothetical protein